MSRQRAWQAIRAGLALLALAGGPTLPLLSLVEVDGPVTSCCGRGRCCCAGAARVPAGACLRSACGCGEHAPSECPAPLLTEAVLSACPVPALPRPGGLTPTEPPASPLARSDGPPVPPPKPPLSA